ncbi:MAG: hypothetical protein M1822_005487 [Bathelium mastoideum]|nr:MAG: hypothetical protein M1822_005487 [Bathelium mastoideum]
MCLAAGANAKKTLGHRNHEDALWIAASKGHRTLVEILVAQGVDIETSEKERQSSRHTTRLLRALAERSKNSMALFLIALGANVSARSPDGTTVLQQASMTGYAEVVEACLKNGANVHDVDSQGSTALHLALDMPLGKQNVFGTVKCLLDYGASVESQNFSNQTPKDIWNSRSEVERIFGGKLSPSTCGTYGRKPNHEQIQQERSMIIENRKISARLLAAAADVKAHQEIKAKRLADGVALDMMWPRIVVGRPRPKISQWATSAYSDKGTTHTGFAKEEGNVAPTGDRNESEIPQVDDMQRPMADAKKWADLRQECDGIRLYINQYQVPPKVEGGMAAGVEKK